MTTSLGELKCVLSLPETPGVPSVINTLPLELNLTTWCPRLPAGARAGATASVTQTLPSRSTSMPCGQMNIPPPKLATTLPSGLNLITESSFESRHSSPNRFGSVASHRTIAQMCWPSGSMVTSPTAPICRPAGICGQPSTARYGFGSA